MSGELHAWTVNPLRFKPFATKRISVGVPVRPWISNTPLRPPGRWKETFLIMTATIECPALNYEESGFTNF